jgi:outer membrane immunogenic protein
MRRWFISFCMLSLSSSAFGADYDLPRLRGSSDRFVPAAPQFARWEGFYAGGQFGYGLSQMNFSNAFDAVNIFDSTIPFTAPLGQVSSWANLGKTFPGATSYGGFIGYNRQWEDAVLGVEINYNHTSLRGRSSRSRCYSDVDTQCLAEITLGDGNDYNVTVDASASAHVTDYATIRGKAGWAYENIMPYAVIGLAVGRVITTRTATATGTPITLGAPFVTTEGDTTTRFNFGYSLGLGIDVLLLSNLFVRAEYDYTYLSSLVGGININNVRAGAGVKF